MNLPCKVRIIDKSIHAAAHLKSQMAAYRILYAANALRVPMIAPVRMSYQWCDWSTVKSEHKTIENMRGKLREVV